MVLATLMRLNHLLYFWGMTTEKTATNGDLLGAISPRRGGTIMQILHWKPMAWSLDVVATLPFVVSMAGPSASAAKTQRRWRSDRWLKACATNAGRTYR
jgi:hypothetical protein